MGGDLGTTHSELSQEKPDTQKAFRTVPMMTPRDDPPGLCQCPNICRTIIEPLCRYCRQCLERTPQGICSCVFSSGNSCCIYWGSDGKVSQPSEHLESLNFRTDTSEYPYPKAVNALTMGAVADVVEIPMRLKTYSWKRHWPAAVLHLNFFTPEHFASGDCKVSPDQHFGKSLSYEELVKHLRGEEFRLIRRFVITQATGKQRIIDDAVAGGQSEVSTDENILDSGNALQPAHHFDTQAFESWVESDLTGNLFVDRLEPGASRYLVNLVQYWTTALNEWIERDLARRDRRAAMTNKGSSTPNAHQAPEVTPELPQAQEEIEVVDSDEEAVLSTDHEDQAEPRLNGPQDESAVLSGMDMQGDSRPGIPPTMDDLAEYASENEDLEEHPLQITHKPSLCGVCGDSDLLFKDQCFECRCYYHEEVCGTSISQIEQGRRHSRWYCKSCMLRRLEANYIVRTVGTHLPGTGEQLIERPICHVCGFDNTATPIIICADPPGCRSFAHACSCSTHVYGRWLCNPCWLWTVDARMQEWEDAHNDEEEFEDLADGEFDGEIDEGRASDRPTNTTIEDDSPALPLTEGDDYSSETTVLDSNDSAASIFDLMYVSECSAVSQ